MLKQYDWPIAPTTENPFQSFVTTMSSGFYVSFKGVFKPESHFAIVFTAFSYMGEFKVFFFRFFSYQFEDHQFNLKFCDLQIVSPGRSFCVRIIDAFRSFCNVMVLIIVVMVAMKPNDVP